MVAVNYKYIVVGYGAAGGGNRMYCPEPDCGRGHIGNDSAGTEFERGFKTLQQSPGANPPSVAGGLGFDSRLDAENWLQSPDGLKFAATFLSVLMIRSIG